MIKVDMEMPTNCANCPMVLPVKNGLRTEYLCKLTWKRIQRESLFTRQEWCQIHEIKEEGR